MEYRITYVDGRWQGEHRYAIRMRNGRTVWVWADSPLEAVVRADLEGEQQLIAWIELDGVRVVTGEYLLEPNVVRPDDDAIDELTAVLDGATAAAIVRIDDRR
jgi:hypothetical protein